MDERDRRLLVETLRVQSVSGSTKRMRHYVERVARAFGARTWTDQGNVYAVKGSAFVYPTFVAHTDTVHKIIDPDDRFRVAHDEDGDEYWAWDSRTRTQVGIGGDDKVGIFLALAMLRDLPNAKAVFFRDEEIGCIGAGLADLGFFADSAFVLEGDRSGDGDFTEEIGGVPAYGIDWKNKVVPVFKAHGYDAVDGFMTDVMELRESRIDIACVNVSCGYWGAHTSKEYVHAPTVARTLALFRDVTAIAGNQRWEDDTVKEWMAQRKDDLAKWEPLTITYLYSSENSYQGEEEEEEGLPTITGGHDVFGGFPIVDFGDDEACPSCGEYALLLDESEGLWYCQLCDDYTGTLPAYALGASAAD